MSENELSSKAQVQEEIQTDDYFYLFQISLQIYLINTYMIFNYKQNIWYPIMG